MNASRMLKVAFVALAVSAASALSAASRTMTVTEVDRDAVGRVKSVSLNLSAGYSTVLYLAYGAADGGDDRGAWEHFEKLGYVYPTNTSLRCDFPVGMDETAKFARLFLVEGVVDVGVQRYDYLVFDGNEYIDTHAKPSSLSTVEMQVALSTVNESFCLFCSRLLQESLVGHLSLFYIAGSGWRYDCNSVGAARSPAAAEREYSVVANASGLFVDGQLVDSKTVDYFETYDPISIFAAHYGAGERNYMAKGRLRSFRAWRDAGTLALDLIPTATNGVACLYDVVNGDYYGYKGTGTLKLGPESSGVQVLAQTDTIEGTFGAGRSVHVLSETRDALGRLQAVNLGVRSGVSCWLYVGYGRTDAGDDHLAWDHLQEIGLLPATNEDFECSFPMPASWGRTTRAARFFLLDMDCVPGTDDRLAHVQVDGSQYVQTEFVPNQDSAIELEMSFATTNVSQAVFCARGASTTERTCTLFYIAGTGWRYDFNKWQHSSVNTASVGRRYAIRAGTYDLKVGDVEVFPAAEPPNDFTAAGKLALFAAHSGQEGYGNNFRGSLYSFRAWETASDATTKRLDLVPCRHEGRVCLYNKADGKYLEGNQAMVAGPDVKPCVVWSAETLTVNPERGVMVIVR